MTNMNDVEPCVECTHGDTCHLHLLLKENQKGAWEALNIILNSELHDRVDLKKARGTTYLLQCATFCKKDRVHKFEKARKMPIRRTIKRTFINTMKEHGLAMYRPDAPFTLSSGMHSPYYFNVKSALMYKRTRELIQNMFNQQFHRLSTALVGGPANAAYMLVPMVSGPDRSFVMRKVEKEHGIVGKIDGWAPFKGDQVVLVEDVITTGGSLLPCIRYVEEQGATLVSIIVVVDRNENDQLGDYRKLVTALTTKEDFFPAEKDIA